MPDVNIHLKTPGAQQTQQALDKTAASARKLGNDAEKGGRKGATGMGDLHKKSKDVDGLFSGLKEKVMGFVAAWVGLESVVKLLQGLVNSLTEIQRLQQSIHRENLQNLVVGQALEIQTGTVGKQQEWAKFATNLQESGGLTSIRAGEQMAVAMDIALQGKGGIQDAGVKKLANQLAPMFGSAQLGGGEIKKFFEFASTMGTEQTLPGYQFAFAQLMSGYRASKVSNFGDFMTSMQTGATSYLAGGGTPGAAISYYSAARSVMANEALAATLLEQATRLSSGAYEKPREALEAFVGRPWGDLSMDQRMDTLLAYTYNIPESERMQRLTAEGFPAELATGITKMVSPEAIEALRQTRTSVRAATPKNIKAQSEEYLKSVLGESYVIGGKAAGDKLEVGKKFGRWQNRLQRAKDKYESLAAVGQDKLTVPDKYEPHVIAYQEMYDELGVLIDSLKESDTPEAKKILHKANILSGRISESIKNLGSLKGYVTPDFLQVDQATAVHRGAGYSARLDQLQGEAAPVIINNYSSDINLYPTAGSDPANRNPGQTRTGDI